MAAVITISKAIELLDIAHSSGASLLWIERDGIALGSVPNQSDLRLDLVSEALISNHGGRAEDSPWGADDSPWARQAAAEGLEARAFAPSLGERRTGYYSVTIDGVRHDANSQKSLLLTALAAIESARPGTLEKLSRDKGRTKRIVARHRDDLHANPAQGKKFGVRLNDEWWVTTNNSFAETQRFIRRAAWYAGLPVDIRPGA